MHRDAYRILCGSLSIHCRIKTERRQLGPCRRPARIKWRQMQDSQKIRHVHCLEKQGLLERFIRLEKMAREAEVLARAALCTLCGNARTRPAASWASWAVRSAQSSSDFASGTSSIRSSTTWHGRKEEARQGHRV